MSGVDNSEALLQRWALLSQAYQLFGRMVERSLGAWDIRCTQYRTLALIEHTPEGVSPTVIASYFAQEMQSVTSLLQRMEQRGLVRRQPDPSDGRSVLIELTDAGRQTLKESEPAAHEACQSFFDPIPDEQIALLDNMLRHLRDAAATSVGLDPTRLDAPITNMQYDGIADPVSETLVGTP